MFNKKKQQAYLDALSSQEYIIMVTEHVLEQLKNIHTTQEHYEDLYKNVCALHADIEASAKNLPNYELYKREFRKQDLSPDSNDINKNHDDTV
jgi:hypothetical protein